MSFSLYFTSGQSFLIMIKIYDINLVSIQPNFAAERNVLNHFNYRLHALMSSPTIHDNPHCCTTGCTRVLMCISSELVHFGLYNYVTSHA